MRTRTEHRTNGRSSARRSGPLAAAGLAAVLLIVSLGSGASGVVAKGGRVDLEKPMFSDPTSITNPLFSRDTRSQIIQLGAEGKDELRFEITYLPDTKLVKWNGQRVETRVTHFVAYMNGRILEVATDFYAQADDGSVWYFGENVDNYVNGVIVDHEGTWLAGKDGPPGMIMPADPQVGDVYRPENIPGLVFEEVTVKRAGVTVYGPRGRVPGAVFVQERLMDGTIEDKIFAPGYGEFKAQVASLDELYKLALAVPIDALGGSVPRTLSAIRNGVSEVFEAAAAERWNQLSAKVEGVIADWNTYRTTKPTAKLLDVQMTDALGVLEDAVTAKRLARVRQAALGVAHAELDLELQYRSSDDIDRDRLALWRRQLLIDRAAGDSGAVAGDIETLKTIHDRIDGN